MAQLSPMTEGDILAAKKPNAEARPVVIVPVPDEMVPVAPAEAVETPAKPSRSRKKARIFGLGLLVALGAAFAVLAFA